MSVVHHDFLVEIGTEELPPKALLTLQSALVAALGAGLDKAGLGHGEICGFATPRRLAVWVKRLAAAQPEQHLKRRGPPVSGAFDAGGAPTRAALGFAESCGTSVDSLQNASMRARAHSSFSWGPGPDRRRRNSCRGS